MDLQATFKDLCGIVRKSVDPYVLAVEKDPDHVYFVIPEEHELDKIRVTPEPVTFQAFTIDDLAAMVKSHSLNGEAAVFVQEERIDACLDVDEFRRHWITMLTPYTEAFNTLAETAPRKAALRLGQPEFIRFLKYDMASVAPTSIIATCSQIKFKQHSAGEMGVSAGRESISSEVLREVHGADKPIDEEIKLECRVYEHDSGIFDVSCILYVDINNQKFVLKAKSGEICSVKSEAMSHIKASIESRLPGVSVYLGSPRV